MRTRKYIIIKNIIIALLGLSIGINLGVRTGNNQVVDVAPTREPVITKPVSSEIVLTSTVREVPEAVTELISLGKFKVTAYCPCSKCNGQWAGGITSTGVTAREGRTIAVDPSVIPYGSIVEFNGNRYVAEDCGGAIKKNRIDLYFNSHEEALDWGVQYHDIFLVKEEG